MPIVKVTITFNIETENDEDLLEAHVHCLLSESHLSFYREIKKERERWEKLDQTDRKISEETIKEIQSKINVLKKAIETAKYEITL
jgi:hypothetical protein